MRKKKLNKFFESYKNLQTRLKKNKISYKLIRNKQILDFGCYNGNYSVSLLKLGAKHVDAFDFKKKPHNFPKKVKYFNNILKLERLNKRYDFIFCNGLLSHRKDWRKIVKSLFNLLKKGGYLWLSLYSKSKYWSDVDKISSKLNEKNKELFFKLLKFRDWNNGKIFFIQDLLFSKRIYFTKKNIIFYLKKTGFNDITFLRRGLNTDLSEKVHKNKKLRKYLGDGEIRLIAKK